MADQMLNAATSASASFAHWKGTPRYEVRSCLGRGGMGVVYEAFDRQRHECVALKTLLSPHAAGLYQFKKEFRTLHGIEHPNLVRLGELVAEGAQWFFTMELVNGIDLASYIHGENVRSAPTSIGDPSVSL